MWMAYFLKDVRFCQKCPKHIGINMISTLIFKRRLLIPYRAKKDVFRENGRHLKRRLFSERRLFLERRPIKPPFVNFEKHAR